MVRKRTYRTVCSVYTAHHTNRSVTLIRDEVQETEDGASERLVRIFAMGGLILAVLLLVVLLAAVLLVLFNRKPFGSKTGLYGYP